ncbi:AAA ATPase domain-containing protein [Burkholderia orbicola]|uniref:AAA family ATPase n=1 Tax=Burkholderia orbicola TaxID=2978683 RepID=UPI000884C715|nr:AAA ATPase domain-containing protein [Burkholderia orbicola]
MKIKKFEATKVHGTLNINVSFNDQLTLLVGINGSGKTTVLNMVSWLISLRFGDLISIAFESIYLSFSIENKDFLLTVGRTQDRLVLSLVGDENLAIPIVVALRHPEIEAQGTESYTRALNHGLTPDEDERPLWDFLKQLPRITNITLERVMAIDDGESKYRTPWKMEREKETPMERVNEIIRDIVSDMRIRIQHIDTQLTRDLLVSSFMPRNNLLQGDFVEDMGEFAKNIYSIERDLNSALGDAQNNEGLALYFQELRGAWDRFEKIPEHELKNDFVYWKREMTRLRAVSQAFDRAKEKRGRVSNKWDKYIETLNDLFEDSGKKVNLGKKSSQLTFSFLNETSHAVGNKIVRVPQRNLDKLSSGERQLLILLTYVAFPQKGSKTIIIDEPELSLHIRWQERFLNALIALADKDLQIVIATHSPAIVGRNKKDCVVMPRLYAGVDDVE